MATEEPTTPTRHFSGPRHLRLAPLRISSSDKGPGPTQSANPPKTKRKASSGQKRLQITPHIEDFRPDLVLAGRETARIHDDHHNDELALHSPDHADHNNSEIDVIVTDTAALAPPETKTEAQAETKEHARLKNVGNMASLLLDTRRALRFDYKIVDTGGDESPREHGAAIGLEELWNDHNFATGAESAEMAKGVFAAIEQSFQTPIPRVSKSTRARAEKIKSMIGAHYLLLNRYVERGIIGNGEYIEVEGVYNPLQTIRNRQVRAKNRDHLKQMTIKAIPLACNMFSSHNPSGFHHSPEGKWKMKWAVEVQELASDFSWQRLHWHELKRPNGELWYPPPPLNSHPDPRAKKTRLNLKRQYESLLPKGVPLAVGDGYQTPKSKGSHRKRIHDRLFHVEDDPNPNSNSYTNAHMNKTHRRGSSHGSTSLVDDNLNLFKITGGKKNRKKSLGISGSSENDTPTTNLPTLLKGRLFKKVAGPSESGSGSNTGSGSVVEDYQDESDEVSLIDESVARLSTGHGSSQTGLAPPMTSNHSYGEPKVSLPIIGISTGFDDSAPPTDNSVEVLNINDIAIKPVERSPDPDESVDITDSNKSVDGTENLVDTQHEMLTPAQCQETNDNELINVVNCYKYLDSLVEVRSHFALKILPNLIRSHHQDVSQLTNVEIPKLSEISIKVNDDLLPEYENMYDGLLDEMQTLIHMVNNNYSIRIDNLLSSSDRLIGEINTSLSLEMRKFNEKIDRLNSSMFGGRFSIERNEQKDKLMHMSDSNLLYYVLENIIIIILRLIWFFATIFQAIRFCVVMVYRAVRIIFG